MSFKIPIQIDPGNTEAAIRKVTDELARAERIGKQAGEVVSKAVKAGEIPAEKTAEAVRALTRELTGVERAAERAAAASAKINTGGLGSFLGDIQRGAGGLAEFGANISLVTGGVTGMVSSIASATTALVDWGVGQAFVNDGLIQMRNRLRNVTQGYDEMVRAQGLTLDLANRTNTDWNVTIDVFSRVSRVTNTLGFSMDRTGRFAETLTKMFAASGKSANENASAMLQLSQALGSGVLQGDEFRSIAENAPQLLDAFASRLGVTRGELKKLASEGKITTDVMIDGIEKMAERSDAAFAAMEKTFAQRMIPTLNALKQDPRALSKAASDPTAMWDLMGTAPTEFAEGMGLTSIADRMGVDFANQTIKVSEFNKEIGRMTGAVGDLAKEMGGAVTPATKTLDENIAALTATAREATPTVVTFNDAIAAGKAMIKPNVQEWSTGFEDLGDVLTKVGSKADDLMLKLAGLAGVDTKGSQLVRGLFGQAGVDFLDRAAEAANTTSGGWNSAGEDPLQRGSRELAAGKRRGPRAGKKVDPWAEAYVSDTLATIDVGIAAIKSRIELFNEWKARSVGDMDTFANAGVTGLGAIAGGPTNLDFAKDPDLLKPADAALTGRVDAEKNRQAYVLEQQTKQFAEYEKVATQALGRVEDAFVKLFTTGEFGAKEMFSAIMADLTRMATHRLLMSLLGAALPSSGGATFAGGAAATGGLAHGGSWTAPHHAAHGLRIGGSSTVGDKVPFIAMVNSGETVDIRNRFQQGDQGGGQAAPRDRVILVENGRQLTAAQQEEDVIRIVMKAGFKRGR